METTVENEAISITDDAILLRRKNVLPVIVNKEDFNNNLHVKAINTNIASLGYTLSPELFAALKTKSIGQLTLTNNFLVDTLSDMVGDNVTYRPLFRNFPKDVPDDINYLIERVVGHYTGVFGLTDNAKLLSCGCVIDTETFDMKNFGACPICQFQISDKELLPSKERKELKEKVKLKVIGLAKEGDIFKIFTNLLSSKTSISQSDKADISNIFEIYKNEIGNHFPETIPHKEILAHVASLVLKYLPSFDLLKDSVKTSTDVLRIAATMSDGDVSLATNTKYKKFSKKERKFLLFLLNNCNNIEEDMLRYKNKWLFLGRVLHPREYTTRFPVAAEAFAKIRNGVKIETFNSKAELLLKLKEFKNLTEHLKSRPTELARKLDLIFANVCGDLSSDISMAAVMVQFKEIIGSIPTPTLLQVMANFRIRVSKEKDIRIIMPKGNVAKVKVIPETREPMDEYVSDSIVFYIKEELKKRFAKLPPMGKVFIHRKLAKYIVPFSQRSASKSLHTITRGSHVQIPKQNTIRMFVYWKEKEQRFDLDLSAVMYDENWKYIEHISYTNLSSKLSYKATHSGDITSAPNGASEFIDIDTESILKYGGRYIIMNVISYSGGSFNTLTDCFAGIMGRDDVKEGEIFEPTTVKQKFDVTADTFYCIPLVLDVKKKKIIWTDIALKARPKYNNVEASETDIKDVAQAMCKMKDYKPNIHELLTLHAESRGKIVEYDSDADIVFNEKNIPFEIDTIIGQYLI